MKKTILLISFLATCTFSNAFAAELAPNVKFKDSYTIVSDKNMYRDFAPLNADGSVNAIVEIPTGDNEKWEVGKDGIMTWELRNGKPRIVEYLGYPGNYGMIPRTIGGDGDSLDILILGPAVPRGTWMNVKIIGALKMLDKNEVDDKLIAVVPNSYFGACNDLSELDQKFPNATTIIETWFSNYKGAGKMKSLGYVEANEAKQILADAVNEYK